MKSKLKCLLSILLVFAMVLTSQLATFASETQEVNVDAVAKNSISNVYYDDVMDALLEATENETVILLEDTSVSMITVPEDVTLDLNGYALTSNYVTCFGNIVDESEDNTGVLNVSSKRFLIQENNKQLPVREGNGYRFFDVSNFNTRYLKDTSKYVFQPFIEKEAHSIINNGKASSGVTINVRVSWTQNEGVRSQDFVYTYDKIEKFFNSYSVKNDMEKYGQMFTLVLGGTDAFENISFKAVVVSDTGVEISSVPTIINIGGNVSTDENNQVTEEVTLQNGHSSAVVNQGTQLEENTNELTFTVEEMDVTNSDILLEDTEEMVSMDVHVEGVASNNTVPIIVTLDKIAPEFLNQGNIKLYHVENGETVEMTRVYSLEELDAHNEFYYDIATGTITMALATFSEIAVVSDIENEWNGDIDAKWYNTTDTEFIIYNADQFAGFNKIVSGDPAYVAEVDSFAGKTVKLAADINIGHDTTKDVTDKNILWYPIGAWLPQDTSNGYDDVWYSWGGPFEGTFDATGHTIKNIYQRTWDMDGNYDAGYWDTAMGIFGWVRNGTVKNLVIENFATVGEFTPTGCVTAYGIGNCTFENITLLDCHPATYNTGGAGIVGWDDGGDDTSDEEKTHYVFNNITIDNSNEIEALWGSWDVGCAGILGYLGQYSTAEFNNCHVAAVLNVYNDVCANYQYYWYRYCGMLIGTVDRTYKDANGYTAIDLNGITVNNCTVNFGGWNDYYYCELVRNSLASYTHDHQFSKLVEVDAIPAEPGNGNYLITTRDENGNVITAECYHYKNGVRFYHSDEGTETDPDTKETVLVEDKTLVNLPFNQIFGGYGWGVKGTQFADIGENNEVLGVTIGYNESIKKFEGKGVETVASGTVISVGELFNAIADIEPGIDNGNVKVTVSPVGKNSSASGVYTANTDDWSLGTVVFNGEGVAQIIITDYYFCRTTSMLVNVVNSKFEVKADSATYTSGSSIKLGDLFAETGNGTVVNDENVEINFTVLGGTVAADYVSGPTWEQGTVNLSGTGSITVTITDNNYCVPTTVILNVVNVDKFTTVQNSTPSYVSGTTVSVGSLFGANAAATLGINSEDVEITVVGDNGTIEHIGNATDWKQGTIRFYGVGSVTISITDNNCCKAKTFTVTLTRAAGGGDGVVLPDEEWGDDEGLVDSGEDFTVNVNGTFTDNMVIQRNKTIEVYGTASKVGGIVYVTLGDETKYGIVDSHNNWSVVLNAREANATPQSMKIYTMAQGVDGGISIDGILIGDVYIIAGQSNAQVSLNSTLGNNSDFVNTISESDNIRLYTQWFWDCTEYWGEFNQVGIKYQPITGEAQTEPPAGTQWNVNSVNNAKGFSAVGYYFAKKVADNTDVPIGVIQCVAGASALCDFMTPEGYVENEHNNGLSQFYACDIYKALIHPFARTEIAGMIFYQGEGNETAASTYAENLADFVGQMRTVFGSDMPFYNVQLPSHNAGANWPGMMDIRFEQADALSMVDNYYLVGTMDVAINSSDTDAAHPTNKKYIGDRLAYLTLANVYDPAIYAMNDYGSPKVSSVSVQGNYAYIYFDNCGSGLVSGSVKGFTDYNTGAALSAVVEGTNCVKVTLTSGVRTIAYGDSMVATSLTHNLRNSNGMYAVAFRVSV